MSNTSSCVALDEKNLENDAKLEEGHTAEKEVETKPQRRNGWQLLKDLYPIFIIIVAFSIDMSLYLNSIYPYIQSLTSDQASYYYALTLSLTAVAQIIVSFSVGYIAEKIGSLKLVVVSLMFLYCVGNLLYSLASPGALNHVGWVVVGRTLCGAAEGSGSLGNAYIAVATTKEERLQAMSMFRTFMILGLVSPGLASLLGLCNFYIGHYHINNYTAPPLFNTLLTVILNIIVALKLKDIKRPAVSPMQGIREIFKVGPSALLFLQFSSAFAVSTVQFLMPYTFWEIFHYGTSLQGGIMAAILIVSMIGPLFSHNLNAFLKKFSGPGQAEILLSAYSFFVVFIGNLIMLLVLVLNSESVGTQIVWILGATICYTAYNLQAGVHPSLFSKLIEPKYTVSLMPWMIGMLAIAKIAAPEVGTPLLASKVYAIPIALCLVSGGLGLLLKSRLSTSD
ncbi:uncharacterized protein VTP21DRAFT_1586 [Calcarisporiella thermophila]|uniref:uncharacterized protein n=1 Tax=Calcarisporiella thermophila TaxID=911321 RepID=UPI003742D4C1